MLAILCAVALAVSGMEPPLEEQSEDPALEAPEASGEEGTDEAPREREVATPSPFGDATLPDVEYTPPAPKQPEKPPPPPTPADACKRADFDDFDGYTNCRYRAMEAVEAYESDHGQIARPVAAEPETERAPLRPSSKRHLNAWKLRAWDEQETRLTNLTIGFGVAWGATLVATLIMVGVGAAQADECVRGDPLAAGTADDCSEATRTVGNLAVPIYIGGAISGGMLVGLVVSGAMLGAHRAVRPYLVERRRLQFSLAADGFGFRF